MEGCLWGWEGVAAPGEGVGSVGLRRCWGSGPSEGSEGSAVGLGWQFWGLEKDWGAVSGTEGLWGFRRQWGCLWDWCEGSRSGGAGEHGEGCEWA